MARRLYKEGFTLIEISLSLVFVTILALAIALIISNTIGAYQRGLVLNQVNTLGMSLTDDFRSALQNSSGKTLTATCSIIYKDATQRARCEADDAFKFVSVVKNSAMRVRKNEGTASYAAVPIFGAFCTGSYSYIWNTGYFESPDAEFGVKDSNGWARLKYKDVSGNVKVVGDDSMFKLIKVKDTTRAVCIAATKTGAYSEPDGGISNVFDITEIGDGELVEEPEYLISNNMTDKMAIYELLITRPAFSTEDNNIFYSGSFILGTVGGGIDIMARGRTCVAPNDYAIENFDYCAINKFNFAVQASGE